MFPNHQPVWVYSVQPPQKRYGWHLPSAAPPHLRLVGRPTRRRPRPGRRRRRSPSRARPTSGRRRLPSRRLWELSYMENTLWYPNHNWITRTICDHPWYRFQDQNDNLWYTMCYVSWFINPMNPIVISTMNHSYWSYVHQLSYRLGAPLCSYGKWPIYRGVTYGKLVIFP